MADVREDSASVVPANCAGTGGVEGIGIGLKGEPGVKKRLRDVVRRSTLGKVSTDGAGNEK